MKRPEQAHYAVLQRRNGHLQSSVINKYGNATIRHKTNLEKVGELGNAGLNAAFAIAGKTGVGPGLEATSVNAATGLAKLSAKDLATYAMKEIPWAAGTTYLQAGLNNLAQGKDWGDMDAGQLAKDFALNVGQDVGMDVANYGRGKAMQRIVNEANARANTTNNNQNSSIANVLRDNVSADNETQSATGRLRSDIDALARVLSGQNGMQPAYAGAEADMRAQTADAPRSTNQNADYTILKNAAPDGGDLVVVDNKVFDDLPKNASAKTKADRLRQYLRDNFLGETLPLNYGNDGNALVTNRGIKEVSRTGGIDTRGRIAGNLDEILEVSKVNPEEPVQQDTKGRQFAKDGFEYRQSYVDVDGEIYRVRTNIGLSDGNKTFHTLNRYGEDRNTPAQLGESSVGSYGGNSDYNISQNSGNVNYFGQKSCKFQLDVRPHG